MYALTNPPPHIHGFRNIYKDQLGFNKSSEISSHRSEKANKEVAENFEKMANTNLLETYLAYPSPGRFTPLSLQVS